MKRYLIITADDFGFSAERNKGVMEAFNNGAVTSASVLLNCTGTEESVQMCKSSTICPGLHLNLSEGIPISPEDYNTLTDESREMWGIDGLGERLEAGKVDADEIRREINAQICRFKERFGKTPVYVDGHQHYHLHPAVVEVFAKTLEEHGIRVTRYPIEFGKLNCGDERKEAFLLAMMEKTKPAKSILDAHNIRTTDGFVGMSTMGVDMTASRLQSIILTAFQTAEKEGRHQAKGFTSCELMCHPGYPTGESGGFSWGSDDFGRSSEREHELRVLSSKEMLDFYAKNGIELVSHKNLLEL